MKIKFLGAAREVTGSKLLILTGKGKRLLLDCGMYQGKGLEAEELNRDLCAIMLADSGNIQEHDTRTFNKKRKKQGLPPVEPLYDKADDMACMELFIGIP